ncbi:MAG: hypothetical protein PF448_01935 [Bacteroidales bacterium]|jgi:hypothetical protein|nr:hypothetical protein [Bacteroidales bacterium]
MREKLRHIMFILMLGGLAMNSFAQKWVPVELNLSQQIQLEKNANTDSIPRHTDVFSNRLSLRDSMAQRFSQFKIDNDEFYFRFYPEFNISAGLQERNQFISSNTIGFYTDASYGNDTHFVGLHAGVSAYGGLQPHYMRLLMQKRRIVPGFWSNETINRTWNLAWEPDFLLRYQSPWFVYLESGIGKSHVGNGFRSMILSENAPAYPFARIGAEFANINYHMQWMLLENHPYQTWTDPNAAKLMMMHYLSWNIGKTVSLGLFESIVWSQADNRQAFEAQYLNPLIFFRPVEFSLGSSDNALMGLNLSWVPMKKLQLYSQFVLDDIQVGQFVNDIRYRLGVLDETETYGWFGNKYSGQIGFKTFDFLGIKHLYLQSEINAVRPGTYAHSNVNQAYTSSYQALAHPLGANFVESVSRLVYQYQNWQIGIHFMYAVQGTSPLNENMGEDVFYPVSDGPGQAWIPISSYGNLILQGEKLSIQHLNIDLSYSPVSNRNLELFLSAFYRKSKLENSTELIDCGLFIGGRTQVSKLRSFY